MLEFKHPLNRRFQGKRNSNNYRGNSAKHKRLTSLGKAFTGIANQLYNPLDSVNRFINLALQSIEEDSLGRQFLIESKQGIRKTSTLLKKLNKYAKKIEREIREIETVNK